MRFILGLAIALSFSPYALEGKDEPPSKPYLIFLYGAKGSGRAAIAIRLRQDFTFPDISLSSLVTNHILEETPLGKKAQEYLFKGTKLPSELSLSILSDRLSHSDCLQGALFEDFPQTEEFFSGMKEHFSPFFRFLAINISASDDWLVERTGHRLICRSCGKVYSEDSSPVKHKGYCDICLEPLRKRPEDTPEAIRARAESYRAQIAPLLALYKNERILVDICGERPFEDVYVDVLNATEAHTGIRCLRVGKD